MTLAPPYCSPQHVPQTLAKQGYAAISPQGVALLAPCSPEALAALCAAWDDLPPDTYLKDLRQLLLRMVARHDAGLRPAPLAAHGA